jgi:hypothetical protein
LRARRIKRYSNIKVAAEAGKGTVGKSEGKMGGVVEGKLSQNSWEFVNYSFRSRSLYTQGQIMCINVYYFKFYVLINAILIQ